MVYLACKTFLLNARDVEHIRATNDLVNVIRINRFYNKLHGEVRVNLVERAVSNLWKSEIFSISIKWQERTTVHYALYLAVRQCVYFFVDVGGQIESRWCHQHELDVLEARQQWHQRVHRAPGNMHQRYRKHTIIDITARKKILQGSLTHSSGRPTM